MGIRFVLDWKWGSHISSPLLSNPSTKQKQHSTSVRSREVFYESARAFILSVTTADSDTLCKDTSKTYTSSFGELQVFDTRSKEMKMNVGMGLHRALYNQIDDIRIPNEDYTSISYRGSQVKEKSQFNLLYKNIEKIEESFVDEDFIMLEKDILIQLGKLGALELFHACLSRTLKTPTTINYPTQLTKHPRDFLMDGKVEKIIVRSRKKDERKSRREKPSETKISALAPSSKTTSRLPRRAVGSNVGNSFKSRSRKIKVARNEAEISRRVKDVADLERIRTKLEVEGAQVASFHSWAEAVGVDEKVLQQRLHYGWFCRDKLLKSTRSLVVYLARNYRGLGIQLEDLYQAGYVGVLNGAERFDYTRGYQFSTYVQYWIRKAMSALVEKHSREIQIPATLSRRINQIKKARKSLYNLHGRYPDDADISRFSGLSVAKIRLASRCPRIVGSLDKKVGDLNAKYKEFMPDRSITTPDDIVMRKHLQTDVYELLQELHPRESNVLLLRYGFWDGQCKSLEEIAQMFKCTKEWIRKIEKSALTKLRKEEVQKKLSPYLNLQL